MNEYEPIDHSEARSLENQQSFVENLRADRMAAMQLRADIAEAIELFGSKSDEDQEHLVRDVLPDLSERLGIELDATQNTWEWLADKLQGQEDEIRRIDSQLRR